MCIPTTTRDDCADAATALTGAVYAYILSRAPGVRVTVAARSNFKVVKEQGLDIQSEKYGETSGYKFHNGKQSLRQTLNAPFERIRAVSED